MSRESLEAAFDRIEPKTEAERAKLERLREKILGSRDAQADVVRRHNEDVAIRNAVSEERRAATLERGKINDEWREGLLAGLESQADAIERIVATLQR